MEPVMSTMKKRSTGSCSPWRRSARQAESVLNSASLLTEVPESPSPKRLFGLADAEAEHVVPAGQGCVSEQPFRQVPDEQTNPAGHSGEVTAPDVPLTPPVAGAQVPVKLQA